MRVSTVSAFILAATLIGAPAAVAQTAPQQETATTQRVDPPEAEGDEAPGYWDEVICRAGPRAASRLRSRERICQTRRAWREHELQLEADTQAMQTRGRTAARQPGM